MQEADGNVRVSLWESVDAEKNNFYSSERVGGDCESFGMNEFAERMRGEVEKKRGRVPFWEETHLEEKLEYQFFHSRCGKATIIQFPFAVLAYQPLPSNSP